MDRKFIWAGSDDGLIHITKNGGKTWENITPTDLPKNTRVSIIEASKYSAGTAYIAAKRYQMDDRTPYIWKTNDFGKHWKKIITGIRKDDYVHSIREDITRKGLLYAGTEHGIWVSFNDGENWQPLQLNLPDVQVSDIAVTEKDLVIGTHGRSIYVLDDIAPIREFTDSASSKMVHLYKPYYAVRNVQNAVFYYTLKDSNDIKIEVLDAKNTLIQTFIGSTNKPKIESREEDEEDIRKPNPPSVKIGLNRFEWNLRYPDASTFKGMILWSASVRGPLAPPGKYQVRLTAAGKTTTQPFEIKMDPRVKGVTNADAEERFKLAMLVHQQVGKANDAVITIRAIKDKMKKEGVLEANEKAVDELNKIEENIYQVKNQSSQDPLNFPIKLNNRLASLERSIETGEGKPTDGAYKVYAELTAELSKELSALDKIITTPAIKKYLPNK